MTIPPLRSAFQRSSPATGFHRWPTAAGGRRRCSALAVLAVVAAVAVLACAGHAVAGDAGALVQPIQGGSAAPVDLVLEPGRYGALTVSFDRAQRLLTGSFVDAVGYDEQTKAPRFMCRFYVAARLGRSGEKQPAQFFDFDEPRRGYIQIVSPRKLRLWIEGGELAGSMAGPADIAQPSGALFEYEGSDDVTGPFRHIVAKRAYFYTEPNGKRRKAYVVAGDDVATIEVKPGWVRAKFDKTTGWLDERDLAPLPR